MSNYEFVESFRDRLSQAMEFRDVTSADLSRRSGLSDALISGYRTGRQEPKREKLFILAKALNVSPVWLMGFDVPMVDDYIATQKALNGEIDETDALLIETVHNMTEEQKKRILSYAKFMVENDD